MKEGEEMQGRADKKKMEELKQGQLIEKLARMDKHGMKALREI